MTNDKSCHNCLGVILVGTNALVIGQKRHRYFCSDRCYAHYLVTHSSKWHSNLELTREDITELAQHGRRKLIK
jgi:hypothetical protein